LNFGNPYDPEVYYQFSNAIKGMGAACLKFDTPVTGGNVSFYNQSPDGPVYPTPTIGMVGLLDSAADKMTLNFKNAGDKIYLLGAPKNDIHSSEYLHKIVGEEFSPCPHFELEEEFELQQQLLKLIKNKMILSAHDVSEGGLAITLLESAFPGHLGFEVIATDVSTRKDAYWFGESQSRVVVSVSSAQERDFVSFIEGTQVPVALLGTVSSGNVTIDGEDWGNITDWKNKYDNAIGNILSK
jgi:phosphoribosylformylglycinamidine synthase